MTPLGWLGRKTSTQTKQIAQLNMTLVVLTGALNSKATNHHERKNMSTDYVLSDDNTYSQWTYFLSCLGIGIQINSFLQFENKDFA